jgi:RNA polymerase sigma factor (sigma-70 family)
MLAAAPEIAVDASVKLLARAQAGDATALDALLARYLPKLGRWVHRRMPEGARGMLDTLDVVQDAMIKMLKHLNSIEIRHPRSVEAYLRCAVDNRIIDLYRRSAVRPVGQELDEEIPSPDASPVDAVIGADALRLYEGALRRLRGVERRAIIMRVEMDRSYDEIAAALNKPTAGAARIAVMRALGKLAQEMRAGRQP